MSSQDNSIASEYDDTEIGRAKSLFRFLAEIKKLSSPAIRDFDSYEQVVWISDIPRERGCYTKVWELIGQPAETSKDCWVEIEKPILSAPPELPDSLDLFVVESEWRDSSCESPSLLQVSREQLIRNFLPDEDTDLEYQNISINENEDVFESYVEYVDGPWRIWADGQVSGEIDSLFPDPPDNLLPWLNQEKLKDHTLDEPPLLDEISVEVDTKFEEAKQKLESEWNTYLDNQWHQWAEEDRKLQKTQKIYNHLYSAYQRSQKLGEQYEVVFGFGLLVWQGPKSQRIRRHILTTEMAIDFDARRGIITVHATPSGSVISVEDDMLHTEERPQPTEKTRIDQQAREAAGDFWNQAIISDLSKSFVNALQYNDGMGVKNDGQFEINLNRPLQSSSRPLIHLAPAIILRKRSQRGFIRLLKEIEDNIESGDEIPGGIRTVINHPVGNDTEHATTLNRAPSLSNQEIYFPLPSNKEQNQIVNHLNFGKGVRVQGPPGTGKSHTIVNLICHLLASGKRILVTSETERALRSLRSKFTGAAEPLSDLAVILLGNDTTSLRELEKSVSAINSKKENWNKVESDAAIEDYKRRLNDARERRRTSENDLRSIRESDVYTHTNKFGHYNGTLQEIAHTVTKESERFSWLEDAVNTSINPKDIIEIDSEVFVRKWHEWGLSELIDSDPIVINIDGLPTSEQLSLVVDGFNKLSHEAENLSAQIDTDLLSTIKASPPDKILEISLAVEPILSGLWNLKQHIYSWSYEAAKQIVAEQDRTWRELFEISIRELYKCEDVIIEVSNLEINGVDDSQVRRVKGYVEKAIGFGKKGKKIKKSIFNPKELKESLKILEDITIDGHPVNSIDSLELLSKWLDAKDSLNTLAQNWGPVTAIPPGSLSIQIAQYNDYLEPLELALNLHGKVQISQKLIDELGKFSAPSWHNDDSLEKFCKTLEFLHLGKKIDESYKALKEYALLVKSKEVNENNYINILEKAVVEQNVKTYHSTLERLVQQNKLHTNQGLLLSYARKFRSKLPLTFSRFIKGNDVEGWVEKLRDLEAAIKWAMASSWIEELCDPMAAQKINANISIYSQQEREILGLIAQEKAWSYCVDRLDEPQRQALVAWLQAIERIGKGRGKHAENHRRVARQKLVECQSAIPAWVMPLHRVVDTVQAKPESFDVAIIDEASQSGSEALILNYIAKKVIVVGDDKQIRPQNIGINHDDVEYLRKLYLSNFPHSETFDMKSSYFSQAEVRFPNQVSLREHFRCMPEIIQFSNNNFYQSAPLIPLKQFGSDRLKPVETEYVEGGYRVGTSSKVYNEPEARRLVERLAECCSDPAYQGKSFGIITLLGHQQAPLIEDMLLNEIEAQEYEERKIMVGSAYAFQGDERDVIFLSMVDAPQDGRSCRAVTSPEKEREFNVAASRAKEQLILFHSATLHDLKENSLQYKLLSHCLNPAVEQIPIADMTINELREIAHKRERVMGNQPSPFESWFEVDVFLRISNKGYQIIPQYVVNPYEKSFRIDMVVNGMNGKLAIECDGDHWHGASQYEKDMARQRELERCGWEFWRVRGGAFYRDPEKALLSLWELLHKKGIHPEGYQSIQSEVEPNSTEYNPSVEDDLKDTSLKETPQKESLLFPENKNDDDIVEKTQRKKTAHDLTPAEIQCDILTILSGRPNNSIAVKSIASEVCRKEGIITRGAPRKDLEKKIMRSLGVLNRQNKVKQYKAKNVRVRLTTLL
jgi:very-short-patch-repair endonuclease